MFKKSFGVLQKVGQALMLPVALLPAAGLLLGIGNAAQQETMLQFHAVFVSRLDSVDCKCHGRCRWNYFR